jgi:hypothetical protein
MEGVARHCERIILDKVRVEANMDVTEKEPGQFPGQEDIAGPWERP